MEVLLGIAAVLIVYVVFRIFFPDYGIKVDHHVSSGTIEDYKPVSRTEYERELRLFLQGKRGDHFNVAHDEDGELSINVDSEGSTSRLVIPFILPRDAARLADFKSRLAAEGHPPFDELSFRAARRLEFVTLFYEAPADVETTASLVDRMLTVRSGSPEGPFYIGTYEN